MFEALIQGGVRCENRPDQHNNKSRMPFSLFLACALPAFSATVKSIIAGFTFLFDLDIERSNHPSNGSSFYFAEIIVVCSHQPEQYVFRLLDSTNHVHLAAMMVL